MILGIKWHGSPIGRDIRLRKIAQQYKKSL